MSGAVAAVEWAAADSTWCHYCGDRHPPSGAGPSSAPARVIPWRDRASLDAQRSEPRERPRSVSFGFPLVEMAPRRARRHTADFARLWGMDALVDVAELLVSELMTNALEASRRPDRPLHGEAVVAAPLQLHLSAEHRRLRIQVRDHSPHPPVMDDPTFDDERGRGLLLVDTFSELWGYRRLPTGGKVVWCVVSPDAAV